MGAFLVMMGIALLYGRTGALNMAQIGRLLAHDTSPIPAVALALIVSGFFVKAAIVPFHFWLADAHAVAPAPVCVLLSGIMVELGLYAVARTYWTIFSGAMAGHQEAVRALFGSFGAATALFAALLCFAQRNFKRLLAFSTISHMGVILLGLAQLTPLGLAGAFVYALGHAFAKGSLFLGAGILLHRKRSVDEIDLAACAKGMRWTAALILIGAAALAGMPSFPLFRGDRIMGDSAAAIGCGWMRWVAMAAAVVTGAAIFRFAGRVFAGLGPPREELGSSGPRLPETSDTEGGHGHVPLGMSIPAFGLLGLGAVAGLWPALAASAVSVALRFTDREQFAARVLDGIPMASRSMPPVTATPVDYFGAFLFVLLAATIAIAALCSLRARRLFGDSPVFARPLHFLRQLHSGILPDYVAWSVVGAAILSASAWAWLR